MEKASAKKHFSLGLIPRIVIAIVAGILIGRFAPLGVNRFCYTLSSLFSSYLSFFIPLMVLAFVTMGIADIAEGAGKLLLITVLIAYASTVLAGITATTTALTLFPKFLSPADLATVSGLTGNSLEPLIDLKIPAIMDTLSAVVLAFLLGLALSFTNAKAKNSVLYRFMSEFAEVITLALRASVIPLLPLYICGTFANMTYTGLTFTMLGIMWKVFLVIIVLHLTWLFIQFMAAGAVSHKNPFTLMKLQMPGYFTALGTQSSAATVPVNLKCAEAQGISEQVRRFTVPLCANIHMCGGMISICCVTVVMLLLYGKPVSYANMIPLVFVLAVATVAAPGAPGGAIMTALPFLGMVGLADPAIQAVIISVYITQDSFGTACNVSGDNAIGQYIDVIRKKWIEPRKDAASIIAEHLKEQSGEGPENAQ